MKVCIRAGYGYRESKLIGTCTKFHIYCGVVIKTVWPLLNLIFKWIFSIITFRTYYEMELCTKIPITNYVERITMAEKVIFNFYVTHLIAMLFDFK